MLFLTPGLHNFYGNILIRSILVCYRTSVNLADASAAQYLAQPDPFLILRDEKILFSKICSYDFICIYVVDASP